MPAKLTELTIAALLAGLLSAALSIAAENSPSERGLYRVSYSSALDPIVINRIHEWVLHIESADGQVIEGAEITIDGGMPLHNHGLPTRPRVTEYLGDGNYRVQGMRFHMAGEWQLSITIRDGLTTDIGVIRLVL